MTEARTAVSKFHTHSIPLDMEDIERDWDKPVTDAGIAAKASVIVRVGMLDLGAGTGSFRVREMMHRIAYPLGVHVRADVNLTDIEATCTDGRNRITEVVDLPTTGVNTERIWLLEHFADWFSVNLGKGSMYHSDSQLSDGVVKHLDERDASQYSADLAKRLRERAKAKAEAANGSVDEALDLALKTKVLVTSVAKSLDDDNEEAHRLWRTARKSLQVEDKAAEKRRPTTMPKCFPVAPMSRLNRRTRRMPRRALRARRRTAQPPKALLQAVRSARIACPRNTPNTSTSAPTKRRPRAVSPCGRRTSDSI